MDEVGDISGYETLKIFAGANNFNKWLFEQIRSYCRGNVLEIGSGIGNLSELLLQTNNSVTLSDLRSEYCLFLNQRFSDNSRFQGVVQLDLVSSKFERAYPDLIGRFDTIIALNVIEHIRQDEEAIGNCKKLLTDQGRLIILVPAIQSLYNSLDDELGHFVRYSKKKLSKLLTDCNFNVRKVRYFNSPALLGWWVTGSILRNRRITNSQVNLFNRFVPIFRILDKPLNQVIGTSLIAIADRK
jgi:SAM-dependent methyltransferase